jgi:RNA polymerase sigma-70 factor (ECF subfamily)
MSFPRLRLVTEAEQSDGQLCRAFLEGDSSAFGVLIARHQQAVYRLVRRYARSPDEAMDLAQRAFVHALEVPFGPWLLRIAVNLGKNSVRDAARWPSVPVGEIEKTPRADVRADESLERAQAAALTRRAVLRLPRRQREVFALRIDAGLPFAVVAATLGITEGNAKAHFHHAVKRLQREVEAMLLPGGER